jgi:hypothetical protein
LVNEQDEVINDLRHTLKNSYNEKNEEIEKVKESLNKEWIKKEMIIKLNLDDKTSKFDELKNEYDELNDVNDKLKMISEELVKNQDTLNIKFDKNKTKLDKFELREEEIKNNPIKEIQCNIN